MTKPGVIDEFYIRRSLLPVGPGEMVRVTQNGTSSLYVTARVVGEDLVMRRLSDLEAADLRMARRPARGRPQP